MQINFQTHGPFELGLAGQVLEAQQFKEFWKLVSAARKALPEAIGVYLLAANDSPIYVGLAEHGFKDRLKPSHDALRKAAAHHRGERLTLILLARVTRKKTEFVRKRKDDETLKSIRDLEILLIRDCISKGHQLLNDKEVKFYKNLMVPGYLHDDTAEITPGSTYLKSLLAIRSNLHNKSDIA